MENRKAGENPARARHCVCGATYHYVTVLMELSDSGYGKAIRSDDAKSGDLPY